MSGSSAQPDWVRMEVLATVKAYPSLSQTYREVVCVAGVRMDTPERELLRLYPVAYRDLPQEQRFEKYELIRLRAKKGRRDRRAESWKPDMDSIERGKVLPAGGHWPARRAAVEHLVGPTMCDLNRGRKGGGPGPSLGLVKPADVSGIAVEAPKAWSPDQLAMRGQANLLVERQKTPLEQVPYAFLYEWRCEDPRCNGHRQTIVDWELGEAFRSWSRHGYDPVEAVKKKWLEQLCALDRDSMFFVGDQYQHPGAFLVLGVFWPKALPNTAQLTLQLGSG